MLGVLSTPGLHKLGGLSTSQVAGSKEQLSLLLVANDSLTTGIQMVYDHQTRFKWISQTERLTP